MGFSFKKKKKKRKKKKTKSTPKLNTWQAWN